MKQGILFFIFIVFVLFVVQVREVQSVKTLQAIPDEAIRLRILANSDSDKDQKVKYIVRDQVNAYITELVQYIDHIDEARRVIAANIPEIENIIEKVLEQEDDNTLFTVEYRPNVTFPLKVYDEYVYPAGEYEAVLISIGEGKGKNWWCVLFPPLCFLDFSNGSTVAPMEDSEREIEQEDETETIEVKFFLLDWLGLS